MFAVHRDTVSCNFRKALGVNRFAAFYWRSGRRIPSVRYSSHGAPDRPRPHPGLGSASGCTIYEVSSLRRIGRALLAFGLVIVAGTVGYVILGFGFVDALYQTVTTVTTVGFREVLPLSTVGELFTIVLILVGVGTALYTFGVLLEALIEGHLRQQLGRRRMERQIGRMTGHFVVCGWGRVGRAAVLYLEALGKQVVVVDEDP